MANDFEEAYKQHKLEEKMEKENPDHKSDGKKSLPIYVYILIAMISSALVKLLAREYGIATGMIIFMLIIIGIASIVYLFILAKKHNLISKIKDYKMKQPNPDELLKWYDLKEKGVISEEEFEDHKKRILK